MEDTDIMALWKSYDKKLEQSLLLNMQNAEAITKIKVQSLLASMTPLKIFTIIVGIAWVGFVDVLIINLFSIANLFFLVSAAMQVILTKVSIAVYLYQLILIHRADISEPVLATQEKLSRLRSSTLWAARILFLQLPVWTTFYWNKTMLENGNGWLYVLQLILTISFIYLAVWLFVNIRYENKDKKWFQLIFNGDEWSPVMRSIELLKQVNEFKDDDEHNSK